MPLLPMLQVMHQAEYLLALRQQLLYLLLVYQRQQHPLSWEHLQEPNPLVQLIIHLLI